MTEENKTYIRQLKVADVPWHRLTTAYGRGTDFPAHLTVLEQMRDLASVKKSLYELTTNMEHQSTLWHATPFGMVFLNRILEKALAESGQNPAAHFLAGELLDFFACILQCFHDGDKKSAPCMCASSTLKPATRNRRKEGNSDGMAKTGADSGLGKRYPDSGWRKEI